MKNTNHNEQAFTLLEMSVVIVIVGLILAGITLGGDLSRNAELKTVFVDLERYETAVKNFKDQYKSLPGDMYNAASFWGVSAGNVTDVPGSAGCYSTAAVGTATCNGNGDGSISVNAGGNEMFTFWQQLSAAELLDGRFTGAPGGGGALHAVIGENVPSSSVRGAGYTTAFVGVVSGNADLYDANYGHVTVFGTEVASNTTFGEVLTPGEIFAMDEKVDDGSPAYGRFMSYKSNVNANCTTSDTSASAEYNVADDSKACALIVKNNF